MEFILENYKVKSTGTDGGHQYLMAEIQYNGFTRKLIVLFANKTDESNLNENIQIRVKGELEDEGEKYDLIMNNAVIVK